MGQSRQVIRKLARNARLLGLTVNSEDDSQFVVENGGNDITVKYEERSFNPSVVGGIDSSVSPFLGIKAGNPGIIRIECVDTSLSAVGMKVLAMCASLANDILVVLGPIGSEVITEIRGHADLVGMGQ